MGSVVKGQRLLVWQRRTGRVAAGLERKRHDCQMQSIDLEDNGMDDGAKIM